MVSNQYIMNTKISWTRASTNLLGHWALEQAVEETVEFPVISGALTHIYDITVTTL